MARPVPRKQQPEETDRQKIAQAFELYEKHVADVLMLHNRRTAVLDVEDIIQLSEGSKITDKPVLALRDDDIEKFVRAMDLLIVKSAALSRSDEFLFIHKTEGVKHFRQGLKEIGEELCARRHALAGTPLASTLEKIAYAWEDYLAAKDVFTKCDILNATNVLDRMRSKHGRTM